MSEINPLARSEHYNFNRKNKWKTYRSRSFMWLMLSTSFKWGAFFDIDIHLFCIDIFSFSWHSHCGLDIVLFGFGWNNRGEIYNIEAGETLWRRK